MLPTARAIHPPAPPAIASNTRYIFLIVHTALWPHARIKTRVRPLRAPTPGHPPLRHDTGIRGRPQRRAMAACRPPYQPPARARVCVHALTNKHRRLPAAYISDSGRAAYFTCARPRGEMRRRKHGGRREGKGRVPGPACAAWGVACKVAARRRLSATLRMTSRTAMTLWSSLIAGLGGRRLLTTGRRLSSGAHQPSI